MEVLVSLMRTMAASPPGPASVLVQTFSVVVLLPDPALIAEVLRAGEGEQVASQISAGEFGSFQRHGAQRLGEGTVVDGGFVGQRTGRDFGHNFAVVLHAHHAVVFDFADDAGVQAPLLEDVEDLVFAALVGHQQHAFLRLREHDLVRGHAGFALGHVHQIDLDAGASREPISQVEQVSPAAPMS